MRPIDPRDILTYHTTRIQSFQKLMPHKIRDILLVSSLYDNYLFEEDGRLYDLIRQESQNLNLSHPPKSLTSQQAKRRSSSHRTAPST